MSAYSLIIAGSLAIVISHIFNELSKKTNIPSVLMLIALGAGLGYFVEPNREAMEQPLEVLGIIGLIMIVLEGALDLELSKDKTGLIKKSVSLAFLGLLGSMAIIAASLYYVLGIPLITSCIYATPLAVISSAIVIPSVESLRHDHREFSVYESCISDILGIMLFYLLVDLALTSHVMQELTSFLGTLVLTILISIVASFGLVILFKYIKTNVKIFLFIAILILLYAIQKQLHLSPLILILMFGIILKNNQLFFRGRFAKFASRMELRLMERNFHIITRESSFVLRTFFFIVFGFSMNLQMLLDWKALLLSVVITFFILAVRYVLLRVYNREGLDPLIYIGPRGLITILLFYSIPSDIVSGRFPESVLLYVIIFTNVLMAFGLIKAGKGDRAERKLPAAVDSEPVG